ncbi:LOW QUALITY PROTEIN: ERI1 exoribonuclease 2 [Rhinichthys klamathensis goyatoka]|uniref:LOW QUALITY PROTEIN: ERI1 exoribonuclease 2 n=1 Tax=Rhinichthys klamathensis goyatoka TaxID=3034132 RepID=UPI0024B54CB2|nr:LOW QUALITY PROTEIN: ERI1 exoribonuclease 2 [Rhinichthys klamathensis goyatoka]
MCVFNASVKNSNNMSTKSLAKELGLIRRRSQSSGAHQSLRQQRFSFLIIIDFESTCWREKNSFRPEIIEFPAVLLNLCNGSVESEFHSFVQPQEHPVLSGFCSQLTGITQDQVDSAPPLHICLSRFVRWLQGLQQERGVAYETDSSGPAPSGHACAFVTWSDWDLGVCLLYECKRKQLRVPEALKSWIDLRATYRLFYNRKPKGLRGALLDLGIQFTGREHSGLVDARNTALLAWRMVCDGCFMTLTRTLQRALVKPRPQRGNICATPSVCDKPQTSVWRSALSVCDEPQTSVCRAAQSVCDEPQTSVCRFAPSVCLAAQSVCDEPQTSVCRFAPSVCLAAQSVCDEPQTSVCRAAQSVCDEPQTSVCRALVSLVTVLSSTNTPLGNLQKTSNTALAGLSDTTYDPETPDACWSDGVLLTEEGEEPVALGEEPDENRPNETTSDRLKPTVSCVSTSLFKTPRPVPHTLTHTNSHTHTDPYGPLSRFLGHAPFSIHRDTPTSTHRAPPPSIHKAPPSSALRAPPPSVRRDTPLGIHKAPPPSVHKAPPSSAHRAPPPSVRRDTPLGIHKAPPPSAHRAPPPLRPRPPGPTAASVSGKRTAPLCVCGRRARRLTVGNGGPNHGRVFFCCPVTRHRCGFFQWESGPITARTLHACRSTALR